MVGTVSAARRFSGNRGLVAAALALAAGLAAGAVLLFGGLGLLGHALRPGTILLFAAAILAALAALGDLAGLSVRPQVPLQVPEGWRRTMPLTRALFLYGMLLGTGASTYVPALAAWALLALSFALGSVVQALLIGLAFALGRALLVIALAVGGQAEALSEWPAGLRAVRVLGAAMLATASVGLLATATAQAKTVAFRSEDPSAAASDLAWQRPGVGGFLRRGGLVRRLPGTDPALGGGFVAWRNGSSVTVADVETETPVRRERIPGVEKLAVSESWLVYRARRHGRVHMFAESLAGTGARRAVSAARLPGALSRPALDGGRLVYSVVTRRSSWITYVDLATGKARRVRRSRKSQLLNPSLLGPRLLYVRISRCSQKLREGRIGGGGHGRVLYSLPPMATWDRGYEGSYSRQGRHRPCRGRPHRTRKILWTTALGQHHAYLTVLVPKAGGFMPKLLALPR
jgi:hypothetical protein